MKQLLVSFFLLYVALSLRAQNAYDRWLNNQELSTHLRYEGTYTLKETYRSTTGKRKDLGLVQRQRYKAGYLRTDEGFVEGQQKLYHFVTKLPSTKDWEKLEKQGGAYLAGLEIIGFNLLDSTTSTYAFEASGKLKYYVVDQQGNMHRIYTYDEQDRLLHYKDCMAPFNNSHWCAYYVYQYNAAGQLSEARSYNLEQGQKNDQKELFAIDSMVYNKAGQLSERWTMDSEGIATQRALYYYNEQGRLCVEKSSQWPVSELTRSYKKTYCYRANGKYKQQEESYYLENNLQERESHYYNRKGDLKRQITYKRNKKPTSLYIIRYQ